MAKFIRIRITRIPHARDLEYFALRYIKANGVYEVPSEMARDLIEFGYALPGSGEPVTDFTDSLQGHDG